MLQPGVQDKGRWQTRARAGGVQVFVSVHVCHEVPDASINPSSPRLVKFIAAELLENLLSALLKGVQHAESLVRKLVKSAESLSTQQD